MVPRTAQENKKRGHVDEKALYSLIERTSLTGSSSTRILLVAPCIRTRRRNVRDKDRLKPQAAHRHVSPVTSPNRFYAIFGFEPGKGVFQTLSRRVRHYVQGGTPSHSKTVRLLFRPTIHRRIGAGQCFRSVPGSVGPHRAEKTNRQGVRSDV